MKKVLVVDDNKDITDMVKEMLEFFGYNCTTANSGQDCLNLLRNNSFDLILLDIAMPEVPGPEVLRRVKEDDAVRHNRIVLFTASHVTDIEMEEMKRNGALDCIKKPINKSKMHEVIEKYLS